jgi:hypothetical protein
MGKGFDEKRFVIGVVLSLMAMWFGLCLSGCGTCYNERPAANRFELSRLKCVDIQRFTGNFKSGYSQDIFYIATGAAHVDNKRVDADIVAVIEQEQALLRYIIHQNNQQLVNFMVCIQNNNLTCQCGFGTEYIFAR